MVATGGHHLQQAGILLGPSAVTGRDQAAAPHAGAKRLIPQAWRTHPEFDNIHKLVGVAVITVQLRYNGWVTELADQEKMMQLNQASTWGLHHCLQTSRSFANCRQPWHGWVHCAGRFQAVVVAQSIAGLCCSNPSMFHCLPDLPLCLQRLHVHALLLWGLCTFLFARHCSFTAMLPYVAASRQETSSQLHSQA